MTEDEFQQQMDHTAWWNHRMEEGAATGELDNDDLETILTIARNGQSGRITQREVKLLVEAYREWHGIPPPVLPDTHREEERG